MKKTYVKPQAEALEMRVQEFIAASPFRLSVKQRTNIFETLEEEEIVEEQSLVEYAKSVDVWDEDFDYTEWM